MPKRRKSRIYTRHQGGVDRFYADFRDYKDVGGKREALIPSGAEQATTDEKLAVVLVHQRLEELDLRRRRKQRHEPEEDTYLASYVVHHLKQSRLARNVTDAWLEATATHLEAAIEFFCNNRRPLPEDPATGEPLLTGVRDRDLASLGPRELHEYVLWLASKPNRKGGSLSPSSQRKYLNSLSKLFNRAISEERLPMNQNPVAAMLDKPRASNGTQEARWLEVHDAALLLECVRRYDPKRPLVAISPVRLHALVATMLLTGARPNEVHGLEVRDVSFDRKIITIRPNGFRRRLKTAGSERVIPLWPQLEAILKAYIESDDGPGDSPLLFPSGRTGGLIRDIRKALDEAAQYAGWKAGEVRPYSFRHTYCAARLQTLDRGQPVSEYTVARELGHSGGALVRKVYGHLGTVRHRSKVVEYRVELYKRVLGDRLKALESRTGKRTGE